MTQFDKDMSSPHKELFLAAREILLSCDGIVETQKERITTYSMHNGGICHMRTMPHGIDIGFLKGVKLDDKYGVLTGNGKVMRVLPVTQLDELKLQYFIVQALAIGVRS